MTSHSGQKFKSYSVFKMEVVEFYRNEGMQNVSSTARKFGVDRKRVREWNDKYESLVDANIGSGKKKRRLHSGAPICNDKIDSEVYEFLELQRSEGIAVLNKDLMERHFKLLKSKVSMVFLHPSYQYGSEGSK